MVTLGALAAPTPPHPMHNRTCWCNVQLPLGLTGQERHQIVIFPRLWPFCVFAIVLCVFGFEGGLAGRPELPLLSSLEISAECLWPSWPIRAPSLVMSSPLLLGALWS
jgi:hypothetical protein